MSLSQPVLPVCHYVVVGRDFLNPWAYQCLNSLQQKLNIYLLRIQIEDKS